MKSDGTDSPLMVAVMNGHVDVIRVLLSVGATVGYRNDIGKTALEYVAVCGSAGAVKALLAARAKPKEIDEAGLSPIHLASIEGHTEVVQELIKAGGDFSLRAGRTTPHDTALHIAAHNGHLGAVRPLLGLGADGNSQNNYKQAPL